MRVAAGWRFLTLSAIADIRPGRTPRALDRFLVDNPRSGRTVPFFKVGDMNAHPSELRAARTYLAQEELASLGVSVVPIDSIVFPKAGGAIATNKKRRVAVPGAVDLNCMAVVPGEQVDARYLRTWFESIDLTSLATGSVLPQISKQTVSELRIPLPELAEQVRIVDILEDHLSRLDAADSELTVARARLRVLHKSVLMSLIPDASAYPAHWQRSTVEEAGKVGLGRQRHPDWHAGPNMHPYLRVANVFEDRIDLGDVMQMHWPDDSFERFRLKPGDVLLNEGQSPEFLGRPAIYRGKPADIAFTNTLIRFQANDNVLPEFALSVFRRHMHAGRFTRESRITTNIAHLSAARLKPIEFPIPPQEEQQHLVGLAEYQLGSAAHFGDQIRLLQLRN